MLVDMLSIDDGRVVEPFVHFSLQSQIADLLLEEVNELSFAFLKCLQPAADGGDRIFSEIHTANWWRDGEAHLPTPQHRLLSIILLRGWSLARLFGQCACDANNADIWEFSTSR